MADELLTNYIYIDTCVFEHRQFDLKSNAFNALLELAKAGHVKLLTSSITIGECHSHIEANVSEAANLRSKFSADARILRRFDEYAVLFQKLDKKDLSNRLIAEFEAYHSEANAQQIDLNDAKVTDVVKQYFAGDPPFGSGNKKAEFPDALMLSALATWCERNKEEVYVITRDERLRDACTEDIGLHPLQDITDFLDSANSHEDVVADRLKSIFRSRSDSLKNDIGEKFKELEAYIDDYDGEVEIDSIENVEFGEPEIISIDEDQATIEVECNVKFSADVTYLDHDTGVWDSEDNRMLFMDTVHRTVRRTAYASIEILFEYESLAELAKHEGPDISVMAVVRHQPIMIRI